jgi:hypothetical protein
MAKECSVSIQESYIIDYCVDFVIEVIEDLAKADLEDVKTSLQNFLEDIRNVTDVEKAYASDSDLTNITTTVWPCNNKATT